MEADEEFLDMGYSTTKDEAITVYPIRREEIPIPDCIGLSRDDWCKKEVCLVNDQGLALATGYVEFAKKWQSIDGRSALGPENVGVVICEVLHAASQFNRRTLRLGL